MSKFILIYLIGITISFLGLTGIIVAEFVQVIFK